MRRLGAFLVVLLVLSCGVLAHETLTTTVLFDREIVRILDRHCVMCHVEGGPSFPLATYEQSWLQRRPIRADVISRHMPPWPAVPGYGQFSNDNGLTLRESQFIVSWVEGLGPRNSGTVFSNVATAGAAPKEVRANADFGHWHLGDPAVKRQLPANTIDAKRPSFTTRTVVDPGLTSDRWLRALEYMPGDRRVVRAAFFSVKETGQWIGSWTPWYSFMSLPKGVAYRLPAGSHIAAEIYYRGASEKVVEQGTLGLFFADQAPAPAADLVLDTAGSAAATRSQASVRLASDSYILAMRPEIQAGTTSVEVSGRKPDGSTVVLLFAKDFQPDWPTPYVLKAPVALPKGTELAVTAHGGASAPGIRLTVSSYSKPGRK